MATTKKFLQAAAGAAGGAEALAIEDVFSTYLYTGNGSTQTITNGIDLSGEGGLVWIKRRTTLNGFDASHFLNDTERGIENSLATDTTSGAASTSGGLQQFLSNGFEIGSTSSKWNASSASNQTYASWTWRKAPRFFDVVTYTGDGTTPADIPHSLGVVPGAIFFKRTDATEGWSGVVRNGSNYQYWGQNCFTTSAASGTLLEAQTATDTVFKARAGQGWNTNGASYVAYLFAHDPLGPSGDGSDGLIACGSYTGNGTDGLQIDLGWEPQWLLFKNASITENWRMFDTMRGIATPYPDPYLDANLSNAETSFATTNYVNVEPTGFSVGSNPSVNGNGNTIIYIAIRRGPMRQPTSGTEVFDVSKLNGSTAISTGFPVDAYWLNLTGGGGTYPRQRLTGGTQYLQTHSTAAEAAGSDVGFDSNTGLNYTPASDYVNWLFSRAPGFFDVVAYTGDGVAGRTVSHNLGVAPEMMIVKKRDGVDSWRVYHSGLNGGTTPENYFVNLNNTNAEVANSAFWNNTAPASTEFTVGTNLNGSGANYIAYLFATLPGVSKVGSYTGNGGTGDINVDCGFTSGARFVLIKDATSANDWYVWDTARGIVAGNDPYLRLNSTGAETTDSDWVDPYSAGFTVTTGLYANLRINVLGNTYIFYAIA